MFRNSELSDEFVADEKFLNLSQRDLKTLPAVVIERYAQNTEHLDISHNRLTDLNWIYSFVNLKHLVLDDNRLNELHLSRLLVPLENIKILMLNKNEFSDLKNTILQLNRLFPNLEHLGLHGNAICPDGLNLRPFSDYVSYDYDYYSSLIFNTFSELKYLDHTSLDFFMSQQLARNAKKTSRSTTVWMKIKCRISNVIYGSFTERDSSQTNVDQRLDPFGANDFVTNNDL